MTAWVFQEPDANGALLLQISDSGRSRDSTLRGVVSCRHVKGR